MEPALIRELRAWADVYDSTLNRDDPLESGFASENADRQFLAEGLALARRLAAELGSSYHVECFDGVSTTKVS
jgi:hypothetical protein